MEPWGYIKKKTPTQVHSCKFCKFSKNAYFAKQLLKAFSVYFLFQFLTFSHAKGCKKLKTDKSPTIEILASLNNTVKFNLKRWRKVHWHGATARSSIQQSIVSWLQNFLYIIPGSFDNLWIHRALLDRHLLDRLLRNSTTPPLGMATGTK